MEDRIASDVKDDTTKRAAPLSTIEASSPSSLSPPPPPPSFASSFTSWAATSGVDKKLNMSNLLKHSNSSSSFAKDEEDDNAVKASATASTALLPEPAAGEGSDNDYDADDNNNDKKHKKKKKKSLTNLVRRSFKGAAKEWKTSSVVGQSSKLLMGGLNLGSVLEESISSKPPSGGSNDNIPKREAFSAIISMQNRQKRRVRMNEDPVIHNPPKQQQHQKKKDKDGDENDDDLVGTYMTELLNSGKIPIFQRPPPPPPPTEPSSKNVTPRHQKVKFSLLPSSSSATVKEKIREIEPLITSKNIRKVKELYWVPLQQKIQNTPTNRELTQDLLNFAWKVFNDHVISFVCKCLLSLKCLVTITIDGSAATDDDKYTKGDDDKKRRNCTQTQWESPPLPPQPPLPNNRQSSKVFLSCILLSVLLLSILSTYVLNQCANFTFYSLSILFAILFDYEEIKSIMPAFATKMYISICNICIKMDEEYLWGRNYIGRNWENDSAAFDRVKAGKGQEQDSQLQQTKRQQRQQRHESLLLRPPPTCISAYTAELEAPTKNDSEANSTVKHTKAPRRGGICSKDNENENGEKQKKKTIRRKHWQCRALDGMHIRQSLYNSATSTAKKKSGIAVSADITERTLEHTIAVNFCYVMLRSGEVNAMHGARYVAKARKLLEKKKKKKKRMKDKKNKPRNEDEDGYDNDESSASGIKRRNRVRRNSLSTIEQTSPSMRSKVIDDERGFVGPQRANSENRISLYQNGVKSRHMSFMMNGDDDDSSEKKKRKISDDGDSTNNSNEDDSYALIEKILSKDDKKREKQRRDEKKGLVPDCIVGFNDNNDVDERCTSPVILQVASLTSNDGHDSWINKNPIDGGGRKNHTLTYSPPPIASPPTEESIEVVEPLRNLIMEASTTIMTREITSKKHVVNFRERSAKRRNSFDDPGTPKSSPSRQRKRLIQSFDDLEFQDNADECGIEVKESERLPPPPPRREIMDDEERFSLYHSINMSSSLSHASSFVSGSTTTYGSCSDEDDTSSLSVEDDSYDDEYKGKKVGFIQEKKGEKIAKARGGEKQVEFGKSVMAGKDLNWIDVGAKIGIRLLNSKEVQRAIVNPGESKSSSGGIGIAASGSSSKKTGGGEEGVVRAVQSSTAVEKSKLSSTALGSSGVENSSAPVALGTTATAAAVSGASSLSSVAALEEALIHSEGKTRILQVIEPNKEASTVMAPSLMTKATGLGAARPIHAMWTSPSGAMYDDSTDCGADDHSSISELTFDQHCSPQSKTRTCSASKLHLELSPQLEVADSMDTTSSPLWMNSRTAGGGGGGGVGFGHQPRILTDAGVGMQTMARDFNNNARSLDLEESVDIPTPDAGEGMTVTASGRFILEGEDDVFLGGNAGVDDKQPTTDILPTTKSGMIDRGADLGPETTVQEQESHRKSTLAFDARRFLPSTVGNIEGKAVTPSCIVRSSQLKPKQTDRSLPLMPKSFDSRDISTSQEPHSLERLTAKTPMGVSSSLPSQPRPSQPQQQLQSGIQKLPEQRNKSILLPSNQQHKRRSRFSPGMKMVVPIFQPYALSHLRRGHRRKSGHHSIRQSYQMATVVSSKRIYVEPAMNLNDSRRSIHLLEKSRTRQNRNNCVSVTVVLDKSFLRDGKFAQMTLRIMDEWTSRQLVPRHSKFPIGSCVATSFGIGVLVGWRVEDDCHIVRSLWQRRGPGSALAYLNRNALHCVMEAALGFHIETSLGHGVVMAYVHGGKEFHSGKYFVRITQRGRHNGNILGFNRSDILSCKAAPFIPVIEQVKESAQYQLQLDLYKTTLRQKQLESPKGAALLSNRDLWRTWSRGIDLFVSSLVKAIEEDENFDFEMNKFVSSVIDFLEHLGDEADAVPNVGNIDDERPLITLEGDQGGAGTNAQVSLQRNDSGDTSNTEDINPANSQNPGTTAGFWFLGDLFGGVGGLFPPPKGQSNDIGGPSVSGLAPNTPTTNSNDHSLPATEEQSTAISESHQTAFAVIKTIMRTVAIARASIPDHPKIQMALSIVNEFLLFIRAIIKVQQKNMSQKSLNVWKRTFKDIAATFGPMKQRLTMIGQGLVERLEKQGHQAKVRILRFVDIILIDDRLLQSIELRDWSQCITRLEIAAVTANMIDAESCAQYHKSAVIIYNMLAPRDSESDEAAARNGEKFAQFAKALKWMATPKRSIFKFLTRDDVLDVVERILVRVFQKEKVASQMLRIYASHFHTFRHLRMLNNRAITGKLWKPLLDAADEEFAWAVSKMPGNAKVFTEPISKLFSLGVAKFHQMGPSNSNNDWLDFLMEEEAVRIIQEIDLKLLLSVQSFYNDVKKVTAIMPYYSSIDNDIMNLLDEVELDKILKEAVEALTDTQNFAKFLREKSSIVLNRFLDYLPKMSIPVEKKELGDGWVLTCTGKHGSDLKLGDMHFEKENLVCQVMGGGNVFSPMFGNDAPNEQQIKSKSISCPSSLDADDSGNVEVSILDHIRELVVNLEDHNNPSFTRLLDGVPVSEVLGCAIELWENLEIDDDELLEIAIRDITYHIQMQKNRDEGNSDLEVAERRWSKEAARLQLDTDPSSNEPTVSGGGVSGIHHGKNEGLSRNMSYDDTEPIKKRFNPRKDPTVIYLDITKLTFNLADFLFRIEKAEPVSIFDPVFEGIGSLAIKNVSLRLRIECRKERINKSDREVEVPVLQLQELVVQLEKVKFKFKATGADWLLNNIIKGFGDNITEIVKANLKEELNTQVHAALEQLNDHIEANPDIMLKLLGITIDDLEENVVFV